MGPTSSMHRLLTGLTIVVLAALLAALSAIAPRGSAGASPVPGPAGSGGSDGSGGGDRVVATDTITLITGDVVTVQTLADGRLAAEVDPVDPRSGFQIMQSDRALVVLPDAATTAVSTGAVDARLFDVRYLLDNELADGSGGTAPVIVIDGDNGSARQGKTELVRAAPKERRGPYGSELSLSSISGVAIDVAPRRAAELWRDVRAGDAVTGAGADRRPDRVWLDAPTHAVLDQSVPLVGAPPLWQQGVDGSGVKVAVLDTGWDPDHPDLQGKVAASADFSGSAGVVDLNGHGTHVLSTVLGQGTASDGKYRGVAPGATGLVAKVLNDRGNGALSWAIAGVEWAVANGADIVSMSLGSDPSAGDDPLSLAMDQISATSDTVFVSAAGNAGPSPLTIGPPGAATSSLTVGNIFKAGPMNSTSSSGPRYGDGLVKPEVTAPGTQIVAARAANTFLGTPVGQHYTSLSGTSMAAPHVAGVAALLRQKHPAWSDEEIRSAITATAQPTNDASIYRQGAGLVNAKRASDLTAVPTEPTLSFGRFDWPHEGDEPVTRTQTYHNVGDETVTLDLAAELADVEGTAADIQLSAHSLDVPAGGTASVDVTVDVDDLAAAGDAEGMLTATLPDGSVARTPIGVVKDPELSTITVSATQRDGRPAVSPSSVQVLNLRTGEYFYKQVGPTAEFVVPRGTYAVLGFVYTMDASNTKDVEATLAGEPEIVVNDDVHVDLDAREAVPVSIAFDRDVDAYSQHLGWGWTATEGSGLDTSFKSSSTLRRLSIVPSAQVSRDGFEAYAKWEVVPPRARLRATGQRIDTRLLYRSAPMDGTIRASIFNGGAATPADLVGAEGTVVVVRRTDGVSVSTQVKAASDAGARAVLVANDRPGIFDPSAGSGVTLPALEVSKSDGDQLVRRAQTRVELSGTDMRKAPFLYDLVRDWPDRMPSDATADIEDLDLARLDTVYAGAHPGQQGAELRHQWRPMTGASVAFRRELLLPLRRTDYVSAHDSRWQQTVRAKSPYTYEIVESTRSYEPSRLDRRFFGGPIAPGAQHFVGESTASQAALTRREDLVTINLPLFRDSESTHAGPVDSADVAAARVLLDGHQVYAGRELVGSFTAPPGPATLTIEADVSRADDFWSTSTHTISEWQVHSARPSGLDPVPLPLIDVRPQIAGLDEFNRASSRTTKVSLAADYQPGAVGSGVREVTLQMSTDRGSHWQPVKLVRGKGNWSGAIDNPRTGTVTLCWAATDADGNQVTQTVVDAYLVGRSG